jgi:hypothetical protein
MRKLPNHVLLTKYSKKWDEEAWVGLIWLGIERGGR